jgi:hypothetical protein
MPVTFRGNGKEVSLRLQLTDTVSKIKTQLSEKGITAGSLKLGQTQIADDMTVATSPLAAFAEVTCKLFSLYNCRIFAYIFSSIAIRQLASFSQVVVVSRLHDVNRINESSKI